MAKYSILPQGEGRGEGKVNKKDPANQVYNVAVDERTTLNQLYNQIIDGLTANSELPTANPYASI